VIENNKNVIILTTMTSSRDKFLVVDINWATAISGDRLECHSNVLCNIMLLPWDTLT
jgi:hypothetical protein